MSRPEVILLAGGRTKESHLPNSRLLTRIIGTPLVVRTIRQFTEWATVTVMSNDESVLSAVRSQRLIKLAWLDDKPQYGQVDMIRKGLAQAWNRDSIIVFGDVVFTDEAVATIRDHEMEGDFAVYGRSAASEITGTEWAEYFAIRVNWKGRERGKRVLQEVADHWNIGNWSRASAWEWYLHMEGMPWHIENPQAVEVGPNWVEINDATDDIDFAEDAARLQVLYEKEKP